MKCNIERKIFVTVSVLKSVPHSLRHQAPFRRAPIVPYSLSMNARAHSQSTTEQNTKTFMFEMDGRSFEIAVSNVYADTTNCVAVHKKKNEK